MPLSPGDVAREIDARIGTLRRVAAELEHFAVELRTGATVFDQQTAAIVYDPEWKDGTRLTPKGEAEFCRLMEQGRTPSQIGRRLGMTMAAVRYRAIQWREMQWANQKMIPRD